MILGGDVKVGAFYGKASELGDEDVGDVGPGRLLPTTAVEQMAGTLVAGSVQ